MSEFYLSEVKEALSLYFEDDSVATRGGLESLVARLDEERLEWQQVATVCAAAYTAAFRRATDDDVDEWVRSMLLSAEERIEKRLAVYEAQTVTGSMSDDDLRCLFHCLCASGFAKLYLENTALAVGAMVRAAIMPVAGPSTWVAGAGLLPMSRDTLASHLLLAIVEPFLREGGYAAEAAVLQTELIACGWSDESAFSDAIEVLNELAQDCEDGELEWSDTVPFYGWANLFAESAVLMQVSGECDDTGADPRLCRKSTAQYQAWLFGWQVARMVACPNVSSTPIDRLHNLWLFASYGTDIFVRSRDIVLGALDTAVAIVNGAVTYDLTGARTRALVLWQSRVRSFAEGIWDIGPRSDLYWAMRIGYYDGLLESSMPSDETGHVFSTPPDEPGQSVTGAQVVEGMGLGFSKLQGQLVEVLHMLSETCLTPDNVRETLRGHLGEVFDWLPVSTVDHLAQGELYWSSGVQHQQAAVSYVCAVEATLQELLVATLLNYMQKKGKFSIGLVFPSRRPDSAKSAVVPLARNFRRGEIEKIALSDIAGCLLALSGQTDYRTCHRVVPELLEFLLDTFGWWNEHPALRSLSEKLEKVQHLRAGAAHHRAHTSRYVDEVAGYAELRSLVIGDGRRSILADIVEVFTPKTGK